MDDDDRHKLALWRYSVLGPLVSARLGHGDRQAYFDLAAARVHERPDGALVRISARTIEGWYRTYLRGGFAALVPKARADAGKSRALEDDVVDLILRAKRERPRRSIRRIIAMLERAGRVEPGELSRSAVHRVLRAAGLSQQPPREGAAMERRSFLPEHAGDVWIADAMHGPRVLHEGRLLKSYLLTQLDGATRFCVHSAFYLSEGCVAHEHGLRQTFMRHGLPRTYYVDRGSAFTADSLRTICADLGVHLLHTAVRDAEAKGSIERFHRTWRAEVGDELPVQPLTLAELNAKHWAWLHSDYHDRVHSTTNRKPRAHLLEEDRFTRSVPRNVDLDEVFLHRARRLVRKDGTVRWRGGFIEVAADVRGEVELRFDPAAPTALPRVYVAGEFVCDTVSLDLHRNATRRRRRLAAPVEDPVEPTGIDVLADIERIHYDRVRIDAGESEVD